MDWLVLWHVHLQILVMRQCIVFFSVFISLQTTGFSSLSQKVSCSHNSCTWSSHNYMEVTYAQSSSQERGELKTLTHQEQIHQVGWRGEGLVPGTTRLVKLSALNTPLHCLHDVHNKAMCTEIYHKEFHTWIFYT